MELQRALDKIAKSQQKLGDKLTRFYLPNCDKNGLYKPKQVGTCRKKKCVCGFKTASLWLSVLWKLNVCECVFVFFAVRVFSGWAERSMLVRALLEWQKDFRFDRPAQRCRLPLKRRRSPTRHRRSHWFFFSFFIVVYLFILSMAVFNSGTLKLKPPSSSSTRPKEKNILFFWEKDFTSTFQPYLFPFISFYLSFVIILWVFISFFALLL